MIKKINKNEIRKDRHARLRYRLIGNAEKPRLNVYRSSNHFYAQIINDKASEKGGETLVSASTVEKDINAKVADMKKVDAAKELGKILAERALEKNIKKVVFDRGGYLYTGRIASFADGAREAGLEF